MSRGRRRFQFFCYCSSPLVSGGSRMADCPARNRSLTVKPTAGNGREESLSGGRTPFPASQPDACPSGTVPLPAHFHGPLALCVVPAWSGVELLWGSWSRPARFCQSLGDLFMHGGVPALRILINPSAARRPRRFPAPPRALGRGRCRCAQAASSHWGYHYSL